MRIKYKLLNRLLLLILLVFFVVNSLSASEWFADDEMQDKEHPSAISSKGSAAKNGVGLGAVYKHRITDHDMSAGKGRALLLSAVLEGDIDLVREIHKNGYYHLNEVFNYDFIELQSVHTAIVCGHLDIVKYLIEERGLSVNHKKRFAFSLDRRLFDDVDFTLLHVAIVERKLSIVKYLIDEVGANLHIKVGGASGNPVG